MGIPPITTPGENCLTCYPAGTTPRYLWFNVSGIQKGGGWNPVDGEPANGNWIMEQWEGFPCYWKEDYPLVPPIRVYYSAAGPIDSIFQITHRNFFARIIGSSCIKEADNEYVDPAFERFCGGHATIYDTSGGDLATMLEVADQIGVPTIPDLRFETFDLPPDHTIYRLANVYGKTNIKVKKLNP